MGSGILVNNNNVAKKRMIAISRRYSSLLIIANIMNDIIYGTVTSAINVKMDLIYTKLSDDMTFSMIFSNIQLVSIVSIL